MSLGAGALGTSPFGTTAVGPTLVNSMPSDLSVIAPLDTITFDVLVPGLIRRILVFAAYPGAPTELAFDGDQFRAGYAGSVLTVLGSTSHRFAIRHSGGGWPSRPSLLVFAFDREGQEL